MPFDRYADAAKEIRRVLKPGGCALVMVKSNRDARATGAASDGPYGYKIQSAPKGVPWNNEIGLTLTLLDRLALEQVFVDFAEVRIENCRTTLANGRQAEDDWHVFLRA
jgi:ubiquinone/menaquinone biosynthesis C-methylase UbiE